MKTILLVSPYWKEQHRWMVSSVKLAELWQRLGFRVVVICMGSETKTERVSDTLTIHFRKDFFLKDPLNFGISFGFSGAVYRLICDVQPDLVVVNKVLFWSSFCIIPLWLRGIRVQLITDALVGITWFPRNVLPGILMRVGAWTVGWMILKCAHRIVFFHPQPEKILKRLGIAHKSRVIPTGIDPAPYHLSTPRPQSPSNVTLTYIGRLESVKGVDDFLAASVPLKKEFPEITIQVVGWSKDNHPLVNEYGDDVQFTGLREDIPTILAKTDIFVLPSYSEGLSNALMEAMASGCACVATDVGGNAFLIQNGVSGLLFPVGDREALRAHLRRLITDHAKRRDMGIAARARIEEQFSWSSVGKQYTEFFTEAFPKKPKVVILSAFLTPFRSGAEACAEEVPAILRNEYDFTIITARMDRKLPKHDHIQGVPVIRVGVGIPPLDKWLYPFLAAREACKHEPQIVHAILETFAGMALVLCKFTTSRARRMLTCQTTNRTFLKGMIVRSPDVVTVISTHLQKLAENIGRTDTRCIPNGIRLAEIQEATKKHPKVPGRILFVGRLEQMKGVSTLLDAFASVAASHSEATLHIVGDGSLRSTLESSHSELLSSKKIVFLGRLSPHDVCKEYAEAKIFCALSNSEALGNVFLEAQAAGCAVVSTTVGGIPDIVRNNETGILIPPQDPVIAAETLKKVLSDAHLRDTLSVAAVRHAENYDWSVIAKRYGDIYLALLR